MRARQIVVSVVVAMLTPALGLAASWQELSPPHAPAARFGHTMTTVGSDVYLFGGTTGGKLGTTFNDLWRWDREAQDWVELTPSNPPPARFYHGAAAADGKLYIGYGLGNAGFFDDLWEYDPATNAWTELEVPGGPEARYITAMVDLGDGTIFVAGGYPESGMSALADAWILDPSPKTSSVRATQIASLPQGIYGFVPASTGGRPTVIGGYLTKASGYSATILVWDPDPAPLGQWVEVTPSGATPYDLAMAASAHWRSSSKDVEWGENVIILGGESSTKSNYTTRVQVYNSLTETWSYGTDMPIGIASGAAAVLPPEDGGNLEVLVFGGDTASGPIDWTFLYTSDIAVAPTCGDEHTLCLNDDRFEVEVSYRNTEGALRLGHAVELTDDTGYFWFFNSDNVEVVLKVLDGCGVNSNYWVFAAGLTNVEATVTVTDTATDETVEYTNPAGTDFAPIQDTAAFATCPKAALGAWPPPGGAPLPLLPGARELAATPWAGESLDVCTPDADTLCLNNGRFKVEASYETSQGESGAGQGVALTGDTGYFWFFNSDNVEVVLKVLKGCGVNSHYWVFSAGLTNVEVDLTVTDTESGEVVTYANPQGTAYQPSYDTSAFATCP